MRTRKRISVVILGLWRFLTKFSLAVDLPFGDVNVLVLTDTHSWVAGHGYHEPNLDADYGHVLSFYERLKADCEQKDRDLWFVNNGDFVHGTGLSTNPPVNLTRILRDMPFDAINVGNHELEQDETVQYMMDGYIQSWDHAYLTSNVVHHRTHQPLGQRYRLLQGNHSTIMVFGFLYDMPDASPLVKVEPVEHMATTNWFVTALRGHHFDAVLVLAHMDLNDPLVDILRVAIRGECGSHMPIQFITGHTHYRGYSRLDTSSTSFEAGRFLDTVGFVSFPTKHKPVTNSSFQHVFLDANKASLESALPNDGSPSSLDTDAGMALSKKIRDTQTAMNLLEVVGCSSRRYYEQKSLEEKDSLWGHYLGSVVPSTLFKPVVSPDASSNASVLMQSVAWVFRYDLLEGNVTVTDIAAVVAIDDIIVKVASNVPRETVEQIVEDGANRGKYLNGTLPSFASTMIDSTESVFDVYTVESDLAFVAGRLFSDDIPPLNRTFEGDRTMRSLWMEYVADHWKCDNHLHSGWLGKRKSPRGGTSSSSKASNRRSRAGSLQKWSVLLVVAFVTAILFRSLYRRSRRMSEVRVVPTQEEYDSILIV